MSSQSVLPDQEKLAGHWSEIKRRLKEKWGQLADDELERLHGNVEQLVGYIQQTTGEGREQVEATLATFQDEATGAMRQVCDKAGEYASRAAGAVREQYHHVADRVGEQYADAEELVRRRPSQSVAVAFGVGLLAGVALTLILRSK